MRDRNELFTALARSAFRQQFRLGPAELRYLESKGLPTIVNHARVFIKSRLAPAKPPGDGRQTPMRGHPAFIAQHATAACCRTCLAKWHDIDKGRPLSEQEIDHIVAVIEAWLRAQSAGADLDNKQNELPPKSPEATQRQLF
jgi:hypothetical protein